MSQFTWQTEEVMSITVNRCRLEAACFGPGPDSAPVIVLLHEGLGCLALWRDFPQQLSLATGCGVFAYSRAGYGNSDPVSLPWPLDYMTLEASEVLPQVLDLIGIKKAILLGHSDGASIAAIYLGTVQDHRIRALVLIAPHFFTERLQLQAIAEAKIDYQQGSLKSKLSKYHANTDNTFFGWNNTWLHPDFAAWNISDTIDYWRVPVLAIQGKEDQYGTLAQIDEIQKRAYCPVDSEIIDNCQHAPHLQQSDVTLSAITEFTDRLVQAEPFVKVSEG